MNSQLLTPVDQVLDKALGAYLGFACGDALGATLEFMTPEQIQTQFGVHKDIVGGGWLRLPKGHVTDDTEMALTLGQALLEKQGWDIHSVAKHFVSWLGSHPPDIGETCLRGIRRYKHTGELYGPVNEHEAGNGACMRILPVVLASLYREDVYDTWVRQQNHLTHHNPVSDQASVTMGNIVRYLITQQENLIPEELQHLLTIYPEFEYHPYPGKTSGYIVDTVQTVMHFFETTDNLEDCIVRTVNMGGDADTTGAIVGMLAGAKYGVQAIPERWLIDLNPQIHQQVRQQTIDLLNLAEKLAKQPASGDG